MNFKEVEKVLRALAENSPNLIVRLDKDLNMFILILQ